ncbi:MAG: bifunctional transaldolase/phosoglucose isomerase [Desulfomonilaceae bacterium]|nr:bifunctional transaldolase/phosoglucose isomerase [Desulfomonilaceae bacterium]
MMTKMQQLAQLGQAIWLDYIRRSFTDSGELGKLVDRGLRGVTSNPSIFEKAIAGSEDYDEDMLPLIEAGKTTEEIYEALALDDIRKAADLLRPLYDETGGTDGFVSLEVSPHLARDTEATIAAARRLFSALERPNVMIKVPGTSEGVPAIETLIGDGININVTLLFSTAHYEAAALAYIAGLEKLDRSGGDVRKVASVASLFVSRIDTAVDKALEKAGEAELRGKIAIAVAKAAYVKFKEIFGSERWKKLANKGARVQRPLWASTSTKNPEYPDTLYVDGLIGPDTVNTLPTDTLHAWLDHGKVEPAVSSGVDEALADLARLPRLGVDPDAIMEQLQDEGVDAFAKSFDDLLAGIDAKTAKLKAAAWGVAARLGPLETEVNAALAEMNEQRIVERIWLHDFTVWKPDPGEIVNRLGWLHIAGVMRRNVARLETLVRDVRNDGYTKALLLGMGGSSLAPEVFAETFGPHVDGLTLTVLDTTDPDAVQAQAALHDPGETLFIVSTKSGGTTETLSLFKFMYNHAANALGKDRAGAHFVAITDSGSKLAHLARDYDFRTTFLNDPTIGGRYSALSYFGLVPAALIGVDAEELLRRACAAGERCMTSDCSKGSDNPGALLGTIMGESAKRGRDKVTLVASPAVESFGDWVEQLIAESTGKEGKGILPVVREDVGPPAVYGNDRLFVYLQLAGDKTHDAAVRALEDAGHPVVRLVLKDIYDLGGQFFLWEMATAVAGSRMGINPFDQPNVEAAKVLAARMLAEYEKAGKLPEPTPTLTEAGITVYSDEPAENPGDALKRLLEQAGPGAYVSLHAYTRPTEETHSAMKALGKRIRDKTRMAVTFGYGPRFLHSTGQLHKGDAGRGLFVQITSDCAEDAHIPDRAGSASSSVSFGVLIAAQALGDRQALIDGGRKIVRFHMGDDAAGKIRTLMDAL